MRPIQVKQLDQGHTVSLSVSDSAFKPRLSAPGSYLTVHARRMSGSWPGGMGSGALQGEGVTGTGCGDDRELGAVRTHRGSVWLDERWGCTEGQGPIRKPFLAVSGIWILSDDSRRKVLKSFKREGVMTGSVLWKDHPGRKVNSGAEDGGTTAGRWQSGERLKLSTCHMPESWG